MSNIRSKYTKPEMIVRKLLHSLGYRYWLHSKKLPGHPDIVFPSRRKVIMVHGCFWHQHPGCKRSNIPKSNLEYWKTKLNRNIVRDTEAKGELAAKGQGVITFDYAGALDREAIIFIE